MKKLMMMAALAGAMVVGSQAWAASGCCAVPKAKAPQKEASACMTALSGIDLSAEQKVAVAKIEADCKAAGTTVDACSTSMGKIRDLLTDDQKTKFDAATASTGGSSKSGCGS